MEPSHATAPVWTQFVPLCLTTIPIVVMMFFLARRKGKEVAGYVVIGFVPVVNIIAAIWLASETDASVRAELDELKRRLDAKT